MSLGKFRALLAEAQVGNADRKWFPIWLRRYAESVGEAAEKLSVSVPEVIALCRSLRDNGTPAWQRLQTVRAVEAYPRAADDATLPAKAPWNVSEFSRTPCRTL